jgi:UDP-N-acetyl-D-mannosaminuronate dehydrogenase
VLSKKHDVTGLDRNGKADGKFNFVHVAIPWSDEFIKAVKEYKDQYLAEKGILIVHSTVPVGTCDHLGAVHSPVRGVHPDLEQGVKTFIKYFGGEDAVKAAQPFIQCDVICHAVDSAKDTEALKLWSTTYYGWNIVFNKFVKDYCDEHDLDFDFVYQHGNLTYNAGYLQLKRGDVLRPVLKYMQGPIGGHCVIPNCELLGGEVADFILKKNETCSLATQQMKPDLSKT